MPRPTATRKMPTTGPNIFFEKLRRATTSAWTSVACGSESLRPYTMMSRTWSQERCGVGYSPPAINAAGPPPLSLFLFAVRRAPRALKTYRQKPRNPATPLFAIRLIYAGRMSNLASSNAALSPLDQPSSPPAPRLRPPLPPQPAIPQSLTPHPSGRPLTAGPWALGRRSSPPCL